MDNSKLLDALLDVISRTPSNTCNSGIDCAVQATMQQTLARFNEQAAQISANWMQNAQNQQSSFAAQMIKMTADITGSSVRPA